MGPHLRGYNPLFGLFRFQPEGAFRPGFSGGALWGGGAFDPRTGYLYVNTSETANMMKLAAAEPEAGYRFGHTGYRRYGGVGRSESKARVRIKHGLVERRVGHHPLTDRVVVPLEEHLTPDCLLDAADRHRDADEVGARKRDGGAV